MVLHTVKDILDIIGLLLTRMLLHTVKEDIINITGLLLTKMLLHTGKRRYPRHHRIALGNQLRYKHAYVD